MSQLLLSLAQFAVAILLSVVAVFLALYLLQWFTRNLDEWQALREGNPAVGLVLGAILISVAIVIRPAVSLDVSRWDVGASLFARALLAEALQLAAGLILALVSVAFGLALFVLLTRGIDELAELRKGNVAVGGLLAGVVIAVSLMVSQTVPQIMHALSSLLY